MSDPRAAGVLTGQLADSGRLVCDLVVNSHRLRFSSEETSEKIEDLCQGYYARLNSLFLNVPLSGEEFESRLRELINIDGTRVFRAMVEPAMRPGFLALIRTCDVLSVAGHHLEHLPWESLCLSDGARNTVLSEMVVVCRLPATPYVQNPNLQPPLLLSKSLRLLASAELASVIPADWAPVVPATLDQIRAHAGEAHVLLICCRSTDAGRALHLSCSGQYTSDSVPPYPLRSNGFVALFSCGDLVEYCRDHIGDTIATECETTVMFFPLALPQRFLESILGDLRARILKANDQALCSVLRSWQANTSLLSCLFRLRGHWDSRIVAGT